MSFFRELTQDASRAVNTVLGDVCTVKIRSTGDVHPDLHIKITQGKPISDELGAITAYSTEASILKEELDLELETNDIIESPEGTFRVAYTLTESKNKYHYSVNKVS